MAAASPIDAVITWVDGSDPAHARKRAQVLGADGRVLDPLHTDFVPASAGELRLSGDTAPLSVSLLDPVVTRGVRDEALELATLEPVDLVPDSSPATWLLVLALILLGGEWYFFQIGRMP